jgi:hypothetical protein
VVITNQTTISLVNVITITGLGPLMNITNQKTHQIDSPMDVYFECITSCSLHDGACPPQCVEQLREAPTCLNTTVIIPRSIGMTMIWGSNYPPAGLIQGGGVALGQWRVHTEVTKGGSPREKARLSPLRRHLGPSLGRAAPRSPRWVEPPGSGP